MAKPVALIRVQMQYKVEMNTLTVKNFPNCLVQTFTLDHPRKYVDSFDFSV